MEREFTTSDLNKLQSLNKFYKDTFNRLTLDEERTIEYYYKLSETRGVDGYEYVKEAITRASFKQSLHKPISYVASLCKNFLKNGLYSQPSQEENDIIFYVESKIGNIAYDNKKLLQSAISTNGSVRVMAAAAEVLNNSRTQDKLVEEIIMKVVEVFGRPGQSYSN